MNYAPTTQGWYEQQMGVPFIKAPTTPTTDGTLNSQAASRTSMSLTPPKFLDQFNDFPAWMPRDNQTTNQGALNTYKAGIPAAFDTSGIKTAYNNQINGMLAQGRGHAAAAGAAYGNRALQAGASGMGAGFAQAQAMLPMYDKANQMQSDLAEKELQAKGMANDAQGRVASQQSNMAAQREAMMTDYATQQQKFALQNRQLLFDQSQAANAALAAARNRSGYGNEGSDASNGGNGMGTWADLFAVRSAQNPGNINMLMNNIKSMDQIALNHPNSGYQTQAPIWGPSSLGVTAKPLY